MAWVGGKRVFGLVLPSVLALVSLSLVDARRPDVCDCDPAGMVVTTPSSYTIKGVPVIGQTLEPLPANSPPSAAATGFYGAPVLQQTLLTRSATTATRITGSAAGSPAPWGGTQVYGVYAGTVAEVLKEYGFPG